MAIGKGPETGEAARKFQGSLSMLAWGYNEEESVEAFLNQAVALLDEIVHDFEIVFINDGSSDRTGEIADAYAQLEPRLRVFHNKKNLNVGLSCRRAIKEARMDYLFWQTVDWSYDLCNIRVFLELLNHFDVVQGIRPTPIRLLSYIPLVRSIYRVKSRSDSVSKAIVSLGNYYLIRILFGVPFHDFQNVTFYPTRLIQSVDLRATSSFINPECLLKVHSRGASFIEVPIPFIPRNVGRAKGTRVLSILRSVKDIFISWFLWGRLLRTRRPSLTEHRIFSVSNPFSLDEVVLRIVIPLLKVFR